MNEDDDLLRRYVAGSDDAFGELVRRHVDLVYGAALRRTNDAHLASDVAQHVFIALARHARTLHDGTVLAAWLHTATRNAAIKLMISEQRRRTRETEALALESQADSTHSALEWDQLRPLIDSAIDTLPEKDRASLVLRFFEGRAFSEIGAALRVSEDAARMRTDRALDKLRTALGRRGIVSSAAALATLVSTQPVISAPAGLAATLTSHALLAFGGETLVATVLSFMTAKTYLVAGASAVLAFAIGTQIDISGTDTKKVSPPSQLEASSLNQTVAALRTDNQQLQAKVSALELDLGTLRDTNAALVAQHPQATSSVKSPQPASAPRGFNIGVDRYEVQRAMLNNLKQIAAARDQFIKDKGTPPESIYQLVGRGAYIKTVRTVGGEDYSTLSMAPKGVLTAATPDGIEVTYDPSGEKTTKLETPPDVARLDELQKRSEPALNKALAAFRVANNGANPASEQALLPYFTTPQEGADFVEFVELSKSVNSR
jgi:RNA polymerase sigma factor (sigma-70 family)